MLLTLINRQHKIVFAMLSLFVGTWLLLLCQTCLASTDPMQMVDQPIDEMTSSCHESAPSNIDNDLSKEHCLGACDCDAITATANSDKSSELISKIKVTQDIYAYIEPITKLSNRAPPNFRIVTPPEKAILLPFRKYNILLI